MGYHAQARRRYGAAAAGAGRDAADYAAAIDRLAELGVIPADFSTRLRRIAGFRNVLVHGYLELDLAIVEGVLRDGLADVERFGGYIDDFLSGRA